MKKLNMLFLLVFGLTTSSALLAYKNTPTNTKLATEDPVKTIQSTIVKLNHLTTATTYSPQMMSFLVDQEITPLFDFKHIVNEILSASHIRLNKEEITYFSNSLKQNIISTLLTKLAQGRSSSLDFISARPLMGGDVIIVRLNAKGYSRFSFNVDLSFHKNDSSKWQVFDVALDHDSLINYYQRMVLIKARRYGVYGMLGRI